MAKKILLLSFVIIAYLNILSAHIIEIASDFEPNVLIEPDIITIDGQAVGDTIHPGTYELVIQKRGYFTVCKEITISSDTKAIISEIMVSKPRKLLWNIISSYNSGKIIPEIVAIGSQQVEDSQEIKPGKYELVIEAKGYKTINQPLTIAPGEEPYVLDVRMEGLPRKIQYIFENDFDGKEVTPDIITLDNKTIEQNSSHLPGKYTVIIEKFGYEEKKFDIELIPSSEVYILKGILQTLEREIELEITGDFPEGELVDCEVVNLNGKDAREYLFKPGTYEFKIENPGYLPLHEKITIEPGDTPYLIQKTLTTKYRKANIDVTYDIDPPASLAPYKLTMAPIDTPMEAKEYQTGDIIKPNRYILKIEKQAYETIEITQNVWPDERPFILNQKLVAKQVTIHLNITYDVPPVDASSYEVSLTPKNGSARTLLTHGNKITPGYYKLAITKWWYNGIHSSISILPSEEPYLISGTLLAGKRQINFHMVDENGWVEALQIINFDHGYQLTCREEYQPGESYTFQVKFQKYKTQQVSVTITPRTDNEGLFIVHVPMIKLKHLQFSTHKGVVKLAGVGLNSIYSPFSFSVDDQDVEEHLVRIERGVDSSDYGVMVSPESKNLKIYAGYNFLQIPIQQFQTGMFIDNLECTLLEYLDRISKNDEHESLYVVERILRNSHDYNVLKQCSSTERKQLVNLLKTLNVRESWDSDLKAVIKAIDDIE